MLLNTKRNFTPHISLGSLYYFKATSCLHILLPSRRLMHLKHACTGKTQALSCLLFVLLSLSHRIYYHQRLQFIGSVVERIGASFLRRPHAFCLTFTSENSLCACTKHLTRTYLLGGFERAADSISKIFSQQTKSRKKRKTP